MTTRLYAAFFFLFFYTNQITAQVNVTGSNGLNGNYPTLGGPTGFFGALELGPDQAGMNIVVTITSNIANDPGGLLYGRNWASLKIIPSGNRTVTSTANGSIIGLAGANNLCVDGLNSGGNSLTLVNNSTTSLGSVFMFSNNSSFDTLRNVTCRGSGVGDAVVFITNSTTGNHHNLVENCDISSSGAGSPSYGFASISGPLNNDNTIRNCNIHDIYNTTADSYGIYIAFGAGRTTIENNRIYQTAPRIPASGTPSYTAIAVGFTDGDGFIIRNNIIGGANAAGTGYSVFGSTGSGPAFTGIRVTHIGFSPVSFPSRTEITGNRITGIEITSTKANNANNYGVFMGIDLGNGNNTDSVRCSNNVIGGISGNDSIKITALTTVATLSCIGIRNTATRGNTIDSNIIGAISMISTSGNRTSAFVGISSEPSSSAATIQIRNNTIGNNDVPNSITSNYTGAGGTLIGIRLSGTAPGALYNIKRNTVQNLQHTGANNGNGALASVAGILSATNSNNQLNIEGNQVRNLSNNATTTFTLEVTGIRWISQSGAGSTTAVISKNMVYSLSIPNSTSVLSKVSGLLVASGTLSYISNNMVCVGEQSPGKAYGLEIAASNVQLFNNSFRVTGSSAIAEGAAVLKSVVNTLPATNNIFYNDRAGLPASQFAIRFSTGISAGAPFTGSNNLYYTAGTNLAQLSAANYTSFPALVAAFAAVAPNVETAGKSAQVTFNSTTDLHTTDGDVVNGGRQLVTATPPITDDIDGQARPACFDIGADEVTGYATAPNTSTWTGATDTKWCSPCNWDKSIVPAQTENVIVPGLLGNYPQLNTAAACATATANNLTLNTGSSITIQTGGVLDVYGNFTNNGTYTHTGGDVVLKGTAPQIIQSATAPLNFFNLEANGSGEKILSVNSTVNGQLTLTNGNIAIGNQLLTATAISGGGIGSYIITNGTGLLQVPAVGAGPVHFPVGPNVSAYNPVSLTNGQGLDYSVRVETGINPPLANPFAAVVNRTWTINSSATPALPVPVTFQFNNGEWSPAFVVSDPIEAGQNIASVWNVIASSLSASVLTPYTVNVPNITQFNTPFILGNNGSILLLRYPFYCAAEQLTGGNRVVWNAENPEAILRFEVEHSLNGRDFERAGVSFAIAGTGSYEFLHTGVVPGTHYYRVKAVKRNGSVVWSNVARVSQQAGELNIQQVYGQSPLTAVVSSAHSGNTRFNLYNSNGSLVSTVVVAIQKGVNLVSMPTVLLPQGVYYLRAGNDNRQSGTYRFVVR